MSEGLRLNLGCGKHPMEGWTNLDAFAGPGVDGVWDANGPVHLPYGDDSVEEVYSSHMIEHLTNPLFCMAELWRVCKPDARATFLCPYGSSDDAWENPTHVRPMFVNTWGFFGQPNYWREDYGYRADWVVEEIHLRLKPGVMSGPLSADPPNLEAVWLSIQHDRNIVGEMSGVLRCNKPARPPDRELQDSYPIIIEVLEPVTPWENEVREVGRLMMGVPK